MVNRNRSIISHLSVGTNNFDRVVSFYDKVLQTLACGQIMKFPGTVTHGREYPEFRVQLPIDANPATVGNGSHVDFIGGLKEAVHAFHETAFQHGGKDEGSPGPRPNYGEACYGRFIHAPDGNEKTRLSGTGRGTWSPWLDSLKACRNRQD